MEDAKEAKAADYYAAMQEINALKDKQRALADKKRAMETELSVARNRIRSARLSHDEYVGICRKQNQLRTEIIKVEQALTPIKSELRHWYAIEAEMRVQVMMRHGHSGDFRVDENAPLVDKVIALRSVYLNFAEDHTRVNSMRMMAAEFANELTKILDPGAR